jgi:uncharacterized protein
MLQIGVCENRNGPMDSLMKKTVQLARDLVRKPDRIKNLEEEAQRGDSRASLLLGNLYFEGKEVPRDYKQALKWYGNAAEVNNPGGQFALAGMYYMGHGVQRNYLEAAKWFGEAAIRGHAKAQYHLGLMYLAGRGLFEDRKEAVKWFTEAARQGHREAIRMLEKLGVSWESENAEQDIDEFRKLLRPAEQGDREAQYRLADKHYQEAVKWYEKAAAQGHPKAQFCMGILHRDGTGGVPRSKEKALEWFLKAAEQGYSKAQMSLAGMYYKGQGAEKNLREAIKWFLKAAEQGNPQAQYTLGMMYQKGRGVRPDPAEAERWYRKAADQGYPKK